MLRQVGLHSSVLARQSVAFQSHRFASTLLLVGHTDGKLSSIVYNAAAAAQKLGNEVIALVPTAPKHSKNIVDSVKRLPVSKVLVAESDVFQGLLPEPVAALCAEAVRQNKATHLIAGADAYGKSVVPRCAALLDVAAISDVTGVTKADTFVRAMYAGNAIQTVRSTQAIHCLTVRGSSFAAAAPTQKDAPVEKIDASSVKGVGSTFLSQKTKESDRPDLSSAKIVISGGRGLKSGDNFSILYKLADLMGAAVGASRAAVDAGYVPNEMQIGQTGKIVAPELYVAVGLSGAIQHLAGMKDSKVIVAINKDAEAPIFAVSDFGLVADLFKAVPEMTAYIEKTKKK